MANLFNTMLLNPCIPQALAPVAWFNAKSTTAGALASWRDQVAGVYTATQGTGADQPIATTNGLGGYPSVNFVSNDFLTTASSLSFAGEFTIFCVNNTDTTDATRMWLGTGDIAVTNKIGMIATNKFFIRVISGGSSDSGQTYASGNNILTIRRDASNKIDMSFNNAALTRLFADAAQSGTSAWNTIGIDNVIQSDDWMGDLGEIIFFNYALTTLQITAVNQYLSPAWGITLS